MVGIDDGFDYPSRVFYLFKSCTALYQRGDCQPVDASRDGDWPILGMAWCWRTTNNDHDGRGGLCCAGAWPSYSSHPMVYKFLGFYLAITLLPAGLKVTNHANDHRAFLARFESQRQ